MSMAFILIKRNIKLFFKDKGMFFTSLITPAILLVLYVTFLGNVYRDSFTYSKTWAFVNNFRSFQTNHAARGSNTFHGTLSGGTPNTTANVNTNFEYKLRKNAAVGQVWQLDGHHSIIITAVTQKSNGYNYVWYSAHSDPAENEDIQTFLSWCYNNYRTTDIYRLKFS